MRNTSLLWVVSLAGLAMAAQQHLDYYSPTKNIEVHGTSGIINLASAGKAGMPDTYHFDIRGGGAKVHAFVHDEQLEFFADRVQGDATTGQKGRNGLRKATASGGVRIVKSAGGARSEIIGSVANYKREATNANLDMNGPIKLTNFSPQNNRTLVATGSSAVATLGSAIVGSPPLRTATLKGPVAIDMSERVPNKGVSTVHARGNRLDIDNTTKPAKLTLSGGVTIDSPQFGHLSGVSQAILNLNEKGEITSIESNTRGGK